jgi:hypothetical protein
MTSIYRVAAAKDAALGLYSYTWFEDDGVQLYDMQTRHPAPSDDRELQGAWDDAGRSTDSYGNRDLWYGFASIEQLKFWIYTEEARDVIAERGLVIYVYDAEEAYIGATQATFNPETARHVETLDLRTI